MKPKDLSKKYGCFDSAAFFLLGKRDLDILPCKDEPVFKGGYYDLYKQGNQFFLVSKVNKNDFWRDVFWKQRNEMDNLFKRLGYEIPSRDLVNIARESSMITMGEGFSFQDYHDTVIRLSNDRFVEFMNYFLKGKKYEPEKNVLGSAEYSHTKHFAWIYFNELKVIRNICDQGPIDVLELGSSFGNSIFSKKALMNLPDVHYFGVDINAGLVESSLKYALDNQMDNVSFYHADAKDLDFILEHSSRARFDVVTSSHLLEHLDGKKYEIIEDWLSLASHALVFSIPFDGGSSGLISDHKSNFTPDDLKQISLYFQKRKDLVVDESCIDSGILTFYKSWGREQLD